MQWLIFWLVYPILWLISKLPFWLFYKVSDCVYFLVYYIVGYRKKTVRQNLNLAFPDKSPAEKKRIEKRFYSHMCDMFLEMIKSISISKKELDRRVTFTNLEVLRKLEAQNRSVLLIIGHYATYEWLIALQFHFDYTGYGIYKKIKSKPFDKLVHDLRSRWNAKLLTNKEAMHVIAKHKQQGIMSTYGFIADQSPKSASSHHFVPFFGYEVPFFTGVERLAKKLDMPVLHLKATKVKRGFYEATFKLLSDEPRTVPDYEITDAFVHELEEQIKNAPEYYLWTHKRFKHIRY